MYEIYCIKLIRYNRIKKIYAHAFTNIPLFIIRAPNLTKRIILGIIHMEFIKYIN